MDPPAYTPAAKNGEKVWDTRMKIIVGLDYGTTNSGIHPSQFNTDSKDAQILKQKKQASHT
jgi:hypothetical protein